MNFGQLKNLCAYWLDDLNFGYFTPTQVGVWLNNGQKELQKILLQAHQNFYVIPVETTLVVNQYDYVLPLDFVHLHRAEIVITGTPPNENLSQLCPITINQQDIVPNQTGTPAYYFFKRSRMRILPAPDTALKLRIYYSYEVTNMVADTDEPDAPDSYHEFLAVLATIDGLMKDGRNPEPMLAKRTYYENLLKQETQERNEDAPRSVVYTGMDAGAGYGYW